MVGGNTIKSENIEIAILIFNLLHRARVRGSRKYRQTDKQTDTQTHRQTDRKFFYGSCDKGLRRRFAAQTRTARVFLSLRRRPVPAPVRGCEGGRAGR